MSSDSAIQTYSSSSRLPRRAPLVRHGSGGREHGGEVLCGRPAVEGHRETQGVVDLLSVPDHLRCLLEAGKILATPELLRIEPIAPLDLSRLSRA